MQIKKTQILENDFRICVFYVINSRIFWYLSPFALLKA